MYSLYVFVVPGSRRYLVFSPNNEERCVNTTTLKREENGQVIRMYSIGLFVLNMIGSYITELDKVVHKYSCYSRLPT
jgi:hypothetical protein